MRTNSIGWPCAVSALQHHGDVDAARIVARRGVFLAVALPHHLEQIAVFEGLQRLHVVDFLQAEDVGAGGGDGERGELAHVVGMRDGSRLLEQPVFRLVLDREQRQRPVLVKLVAEAGIVEPVHQVLDVEGGEAKRHGRDLCPQAAVKDKWCASPGAMAARSSCVQAGGRIIPGFLRNARRGADVFRFLGG